MRISKNNKDQDVYHLDSIVDLALLPDHMIEDAIKELPMAIYSLKLILVMAESEGKLEEAIAGLSKTIEFVDDGDFAMRMTSDGVEFFSMEMEPNGN